MALKGQLTPFCASSIDLVRHVKIVILILKNCLVICERFKSRILCFELNTVEKYNVVERLFEAVKDESYFHLVAVLLKEKKKKKNKERYKEENRKLCIHSRKHAYTLEESKVYVLVINGHG